MKVRSIALGPQWVEYADARFQVEPLTAADDLTVTRVMGEVLEVGAVRAHMMSAEGRATILDVVKRKVIGWEGVTDDRGMAIPYSPDTIDKCFDAGQVYGLFFALSTALRLSEADRKNSSTPQQ